MPVLPVVTYDDPVLRQKAIELTDEYPDLDPLIENLFETMYHASGVGLAAPQVGLSVRLFVVDADPITDEEGEHSYGPDVFINPVIRTIGEERWEAEEGCLSIPDVREKISRPHKIHIHYYDREFKKRERICDGWYARVLLHEYDHLEGVLFIDYLGAFRKRLIKNKLEVIQLGNCETEYPLVPKS